jgi:hypothetical protein
MKVKVSQRIRITGLRTAEADQARGPSRCGQRR